MVIRCLRAVNLLPAPYVAQSDIRRTLSATFDEFWTPGISAINDTSWKRCKTVRFGTAVVFLRAFLKVLESRNVCFR